MTGLRVVGVDDRTYTVAWEPAVDNIGVARYIADVNGERHVVTGTQFTGVLPVSATTLFVQVRAEDAAGNEGRWSDQLIVELTVPTPDPELTPPPLSGPPNEHAGQQNPH